MACNFLLLLAATLVSVSSAIEESSFLPENIITKDVVIIGGGASGTYAAVRLREDLNTSIVVIEEQDHLVRKSNYSLYMDLKRLLHAPP
jgi:ribulose 1,5-bisphosphate synthetase/thiazole synthase